MIMMMSAAWAAPVQLGGSGQSLGAMVSWRTTGGPEGGPLNHRWTEVSQETVVTGLHAVGSWRSVNLDLAVAYEAGSYASPGSSRTYAGFRAEARGSVTVLSTREATLDPLNLSIGVGAIGWAACCSAQGSSTAEPVDRAQSTVTVFAAERFWLWEPLGIDLRYEVPLARPGFRNTVSVGVVFAGRR